MDNKDIINQSKISHNLTKENIISILSDKEINNFLFKIADEVRKKYVGDEVHLRGLIEFSNFCKQNCKYCGLRLDNKNVERYRLNLEQIIDCVRNAVDYGYRTIVLQSGEDDYFNVDRMCEIIKNIKKLDVALTLSIGEKTFEEYEQYRQAGADRFLIRIETTDENLYKEMHPNSDFNNRIECLKNLKKLNFEVGSGCLVGLPNQTVESLAEDILFFKKIDADMIGIGPFIPHPKTPLKNEKFGNFVLALKVMALTRILLPNINIPATTAMETLDSNGRIIALQCGANVVMPNVGDPSYRKKYEIYPGKICLNDTAKKCRGCITSKIESIGRKISKDYGFRKKI
jgi:biotin synthase